MTNPKQIKILIIEILLFFLVLPNSLLAQIENGNYYCIGTSDLTGLSFYHDNLFRYYNKSKANSTNDSISIISNTNTIKKGIGTYKVFGDTLCLIFDNYNSRGKDYEKEQLELNNNNSHITELIYVEKDTFLYKIIHVKPDTIFISSIDKSDFFEREYIFIKNNLRINELCKEIGLTIISVDSVNNKKTFIHADTKPFFTGEPSDFRLYILKNFRYTNYYDNRGYFHINYIIEPDGTINYISIIETGDEDFLMEALKLLKSTTGKWKSAINSGEKVSYKKTMRFHAFPQCGGRFIDF